MVKPLDPTSRPVLPPTATPEKDTTSLAHLSATNALSKLPITGIKPNQIVDKVMELAEKVDGFVEDHKTAAGLVAKGWHGIGDAVHFTHLPGSATVAENIFGWGK